MVDNKDIERSIRRLKALQRQAEKDRLDGLAESLGERIFSLEKKLEENDK